MVEMLTPSIGVQARQAGQVSTAPARNLARAASSTKMVADNFTQYYEEQAAIENELILATTQADWTQTYNERKGSAGNGFTKSMLADYDEYVTGAMADAPKRGRDQLQLAMDKYRLNIETKSMQQEAAARAKARAAAIAEANRLKANALISDPSLLDDYLPGAGPEETSLFVRMALSGRMPNDPQGVFDDVMGGMWDEVLTPEQKISARNQAQTGIDRIESEASSLALAEQRAFEVTAANEMLFASLTGGALPLDSEQTDDNIDAISNGDVEWAANKKFLRDQGIMDSRNIHSVGTRTREELRVIEDQLRSDVFDNPARTKEDVARLVSFNSALDARAAAVREDSAGFILNYSSTAKAAFEAYDAAEPDEKGIAAEQYAGISIEQQENLGIPSEFITILPDGAAKAEIARLNNMRDDVASQALSDFRDQWGEYAPRVIAELRQNGLAVEYVSGMRQDDEALRGRIVALADVDAKTFKEGLTSDQLTEIKDGLIELDRSYRPSFIIGDETGQANTMLNDEMGILEKLVLQDVSRGIDASTSMENLFSRMFPEEPVFNDNVKLVIPKGVTKSSFLSWLDNAGSKELLSSAGIMPLDDPFLLPFLDEATDVEYLTRSGVWLSNGTGDGAVLNYDLGGSYVQVRYDDGGLYEVKYQAPPAEMTRKIQEVNEKDPSFGYFEEGRAARD